MLLLYPGYVPRMPTTALVFITFLGSACAASSAASHDRMTADSLELTLSTEHDTYQRSEAIDLALDVTDPSTVRVMLEFVSGQRYDFALLNAAGDTLWRWGAGRGFIQMMRTEQLGPGETVTFHEWVPAPPSVGRYTIAGWITATRRGLQAHTTIEVR